MPRNSVHDIEANCIGRKNNVSNHKRKKSTISEPVSNRNSIASWLGLNQDKHLFPNRSFERRPSIENFGRIGFIVPALALVPKADGKDEFTRKFDLLQNEERQLKLAAAHIDDALNLRGRYGKARAMFKPKTARLCFEIFTSKWFLFLVYVNIILHTALQFAEPPSVKETYPVVIALNAVCILIYVVDVSLQIVFYTPHVFWQLDEIFWRRVEFVFTVLFTIDFICLNINVHTEAYVPQVFRCLRSLGLICKSHNVSHILEVLLSILKKLGSVFVTTFFFILIFAAIGIHTLSGFYHCPGLNSTAGMNVSALTNCSVGSFNNGIYIGAFDNIAIAFLRLFVLLTTENYPDIMIPAYDVSAIHVAYFWIFVILGVFFLTAILLAIIVDSYWEFSKKHVKKERTRERAELAKAWNLIDPLGQGALPASDQIFTDLFKLLKPKNTDDENLELIDYVAERGQEDMIDSYSWTTRLRDALSFEFERESQIDELNDLPNCPQKAFRLMRLIVRSSYFSYATLSLIFLHCVLFGVHWRDMSSLAIDIVQYIRSGIIGILLIELILRVLAEGKNLLEPMEILDIVCNITSIVTNILWYFMRDEYGRGVCIAISSVAIIIRLAFNSVHTNRAVSLFIKIYPVMFDLIQLVAIILCVFATIGMEIFRLDQLRHGYSIDKNSTNCGVGFNTFGCSLLSVFQILTTSNWHEIMNSAIIEFSYWASLYFVLCVLIFNLVIMNLFVAIAIEAFNKLTKDDDDNNAHQTQNEVNASGVVEKSVAQNIGSFFVSVMASTRVPIQTESGDFTREMQRPGFGDRRPSITPIGKLVGRRSSLKPSISPQVKSPSPTIPPQIDESSEEDEDDVKNLSLRERRERMLKKRMKQKKKNHSKQSKIMRAITPFKATKDTDLDLAVGDEVVILAKQDDWWQGMCRGRTGWFPASHVAAAPPQDHSKLITNNRKSDSPRNEQGPDSPKQHQTAWENSPHAIPDLEDQNTNGNMATLPTERSNSFGNSGPRGTGHKLKMKRKTGLDWRRNILGEMTVMNAEEMRELNKIMKSDLMRSRSGSFRSQQQKEQQQQQQQQQSPTSPIQPQASSDIPSAEVPRRPKRSSLNSRQSSVDRSEVAQKHHSLPTRPKPLLQTHPLHTSVESPDDSSSQVAPPVIAIDHANSPTPTLEEHSPTEKRDSSNELSVSMSPAEAKEKRRNEKMRKAKESKSGEMPDWMKKFISSNNLNITEDVMDTNQLDSVKEETGEDHEKENSKEAETNSNSTTVDTQDGHEADSIKVNNSTEQKSDVNITSSSALSIDSKSLQAEQQLNVQESSTLSPFASHSTVQDSNSVPKSDNHHSDVNNNISNIKIDEAKIQNDAHSDKLSSQEINTPDSAVTSPHSFNYGYSFESNYNGLTKIHENIIEEEEEEEVDEGNDVDITALAMAQLQMQMQANRKASDATIDEDTRSDITQLSNFTLKEDTGLKNDNIQSCEVANDDHCETPPNALDTIAEGEEEEEEYNHRHQESKSAKPSQIPEKNLNFNDSNDSTAKQSNTAQNTTLGLGNQYSNGSLKLPSLSTAPYSNDDTV